MRVGAGSAKGRKLAPGKAMMARPTSSLVRAAIFSMVGSMGLRSGRVLDLYAGTGSLGIEALSRGAEHADFVERDKRMGAVLRQNLKLTGLADRSKVFPISVEKALEFLEQPYDLVLLDPPYEDENIGRVLERLGRSELVARGGVVVLEHSKHRRFAEEYGVLRLIKRRSYGDTCVALYRRE
jgi:16S rRNA (guanine966-N2)-methyltransferase